MGPLSFTLTSKLPFFDPPPFTLKTDYVIYGCTFCRQNGHKIWFLHFWPAIKPSQKMVHLLVRAQIGPIIGHSPLQHSCFCSHLGNLLFLWRKNERKNSWNCWGDFLFVSMRLFSVVKLSNLSTGRHTSCRVTEKTKQNYS